jgi:predicted Zn-dependent protease
MKQVILGLAFVALCTPPASAQIGGLLNKAQKVQDAKQKLDDLIITDDEELKIGQDVSAKIRDRFGVVQDPAVHKYVTLVGSVVAAESERPKLPWTFIVLDTDGVNAFASPGGIVHITRGALGLIKNEAELAAVLGHEIGHVTHKHTVNAIKKSKAEQLGSETAGAKAGGARGALLELVANKAYGLILENAFDRGDELEADKTSVTLLQKTGYSPASLADFLARLDDRNKDIPQPNGLFASHPETKERIEKVRQLAAGKTGATAEVRYTTNITYVAAPITTIAVVEEGAAGLTGSTKSDAKDQDAGKDKDKKQEEPKKKGFGLGSLKQAVTPQQESAQVSASGGARGVGPDRAAKGGGNPNSVKVTVSATELDAFKKGIA